MIKICVCIKQTPDVDKMDKIDFNWKKGAIERKKTDNILNPDDLHAIEFALQLKDKNNGEITVITMGPPPAEEILREAFGYGVDKGVLITDPCFSGSDCLITTKILSQTIKKLGNFDVIVTGFESIDGGTGQIHYQLSEALQIPHITQIHNIQIENGIAYIERLFGHEYQKVKANLPILIAVQKEMKKVRFAKLLYIKNCFEKPIMTITRKDLEGDESEYGQTSSPTITVEGSVFEQKRKRQVLEGDTEDKIEQLVLKLKKYEILKL
jgi:electron transfer flavoprotein beta subunit